MTVPKWQPGTTYAHGALVVPRSSAPAVVATLTNATLADTTGWTLGSPLVILADGQGYAGQGRIALNAVSNNASALNDAHITISAGQSITASCMLKHATAADDHSSDGAVQIAFFTSADAEITPRAQGNGLPSLASSDWQRSSVTATAPAGTAYARIGVGMFRHSTDDIQASGFALNYAAQGSARATMFEATQATPGKSGSTEPVWPAVGLSVQDNQVTWNGVNIDRLVWQASPLLTTGTTEPVWPTAIGGTVHDGTIDWIAFTPVVTDPNCPNTWIVAIIASKVYATDKDIVRFCATANGDDWTAVLDAGFLPTGLQQANANDMKVLQPYRGNLTTFNASSFQNWQVDPDPAAMALLDQMEGIGSDQQHAAQPVGNELFYLSQLGVRSVSLSAGSDNLEAGDVGMVIDPLVQAAVAEQKALGNEALATYYPAAGQYWLTFTDAGNPHPGSLTVAPIVLPPVPPFFGEDPNALYMTGAYSPSLGRALLANTETDQFLTFDDHIAYLDDDSETIVQASAPNAPKTLMLWNPDAALFVGYRNFVEAGTQNVFTTSPTGLTWALVTTNEPKVFPKTLAYSPTLHLYVTVNAGQVARSADLVDWSVDGVPSWPPQDINGFIWGQLYLVWDTHSESFLACVADGIHQSFDGVTFTQKKPINNPSIGLTPLVFYQPSWGVYCFASSKLGFFTSPDLVTWTDRSASLDAGGMIILSLGLMQRAIIVGDKLLIPPFGQDVNGQPSGFLYVMDSPTTFYTITRDDFDFEVFAAAFSPTTNRMFTSQWDNNLGVRYLFGSTDFNRP